MQQYDGFVFKTPRVGKSCGTDYLIFTRPEPLEKIGTISKHHQNQLPGEVLKLRVSQTASLEDTHKNELNGTNNESDREIQSGLASKLLYEVDPMSVNSCTSQLPVDLIDSRLHNDFYFHKHQSPTKRQYQDFKKLTQSSPQFRISNAAGVGQDYFEAMFPNRPTNTHKYTPEESCSYTSSALGSIAIQHVDSAGQYVRIENTSLEKDEEIGLFLLQQNVSGHPVASFRFPLHTKLRAGQTITVWAGSSPLTCPRSVSPKDSMVVWSDGHLKCHRWGYGAECTTILCRPNGRAVAWYSPIHEYSLSTPAFDDARSTRSQERLCPFTDGEVHRPPSRELTMLRRERSLSTLRLSPTKHPHGQVPAQRTHPHSIVARELALGNDQTSLMRQMKQSTRPDLVPELYTGASRTGSIVPKQRLPLLIAMRPHSLARNMGSRIRFIHSSPLGSKCAVSAVW